MCRCLLIRGIIGIHRILVGEGLTFSVAPPFDRRAALHIE